LKEKYDLGGVKVEFEEEGSSFRNLVGAGLIGDKLEWYEKGYPKLTSLLSFVSDKYNPFDVRKKENHTRVHFYKQIHLSVPINILKKISESPCM